MKRLTVNKDTKDMTMVELAHNCCFVKNGEAWYRDYDKDISARDFIRRIMVKHGYWKENEDGILASQELLKDETFDDTMIDLLQFGEEDREGLIALLYRNLWAMAELRDALKEYEDTGLEPIQIKHIKAMNVNTWQDMERANIYFQMHGQQSGKWPHGEPIRWWRDENEDFCIKYADGSWWHYKETDTGLEWW